MKITKVLALMTMLFAAPIFANSLENTNLIGCDASPNLLKNCRIQSDLEMIPRQEIESDFYISYKFTCDNQYRIPKPSRISIKVADGLNTTLNYRDEQIEQYVGTGYGPLSIQDSFPKELAFKNFTDCQLVFSKISSRPSSKVKAVWQAELSGEESLLSSKIALVQSLENVAVLLPAYQFFQNLSNSLQSDLNKNGKVLDLVAKLNECKSGEDCDLLYKMSSNQALSISLEERLLIMQLRTILGEMSHNHGELLLKDRMSEQSIAVLNKLASDLSLASNADEQLASTNREIENIKTKIATLKAQLGV
jgi:hypothetical protein